MLSRASLRPLLFSIALSVAATLAFRGRPRNLDAVSAYPRFRTVDEAGLKCFVGVRLVTSSFEGLLGSVESLVPYVKEAKRDAADASRGGEWDLVHEIELVVGDDAWHMAAAEFAQYVNDLRQGRARATQEGRSVLAPSRQ